MALYYSAHTTACLTKQAIKEVMARLLASPEVKVRRIACGQLAGRMITEIEAPDQSTLEKFFAAQNMNCQWVMRIDVEGEDGTIQEK